jgi:hypothetical protein
MFLLPDTRKIIRNRKEFALFCRPARPTGKSPHAPFGGACLSLSEKIFCFTELQISIISIPVLSH